MAAIDVALKNGRHVITIFLDCEGGEINGESFRFSDIAYIRGYRDTKYRISVMDRGRLRHLLTSRVDIKEEGEDLVAVIHLEDGPLRLPVRAIQEIMSHE
ncbi:MAG: hypothetical protein GXO65_02375 [Euryarchaeota archaeon]|nr:hypothetical protein [Euryarchaeota archaeon]